MKSELTVEIWRGVSGYEDIYDVSNLGRVRSLRSDRLLTPSRDNMGYVHVGLCRDGRQENVRVHCLVALAFVPNPMRKLLVKHENEILDDNRSSNLRWKTRSEVGNEGYLARPWMRRQGEKSWSAKLTETQVLEIIHSERCLGSGQALAEKFGVCQTTISKIRNGHIWKHIERPSTSEKTKPRRTG